MSEQEANGVDQEARWGEALGESARDVLSELADGEARVHAERALDAIAEALGEDAPELPPDPGLPDDYTILGVLGRGGSGVVYHARQASLDREVAVKVLHPGCDARDTERLLAEARRLAGLAHPGIVAVHEVGRAGAGVYMTLELQLGGSLQELLAGDGLNPARAARITRQAAEALAYTHGRGVVHLDLKPGNVLLDADGNARVADFGLAREIAGMEFTTTAGLLGTPAFMAPEQAGDRRELLGERTDVYGLGALLYASIAGGAPFARRSLAGTLHAVRYDEPESLARRAPGTPRDLVAIARTAMAKDPAERYPTAGAMAQDLARFEAGEPVEARLPGPLKRAALYLRRFSQEIVVATIAVLVTVLTLLPFREGDDAARWTQAAEELAAAGEQRAALLILDRAARSGSLSEAEERDIAVARDRLQANLAALPANSKAQVPTDEPSADPKTAEMWKKERRFALSAGDWDWLLSRNGAGWMRDPSLLWDETPIGTERIWRRILKLLATDWERADEADRARAAAIAECSPLWAREGLLPQELEGASGADLLAAMAIDETSASSDGPRFGLRVQTFVVDDEGGVHKVGSATASGVLGDTLRMEGRGRTSISVPNDHVGSDFLRLAPLRGGRLRPGEVSYEVEGTLERMAGGVYWRVFDRETYLGIGRYEGSWFLDMASHGVLAGEASLMDVRRYLWKGSSATVLMFGEMVELGEGADVPPTRDLSGWAERFAEGLERKLDWPYTDESWGAFAPAKRAALLDDVAVLAALGSSPAQRSLSILAGKLEAASREPAALSDDFFERGTFTGTTTAGADFGYWLEAARREAEGEASVPLAVLSELPLPGSGLSPSGSSSGWKAWLYSVYVAVGLWLLVLALREPHTGCKRLPAAAWGILMASQGIDKTTPSQFAALGSLPWDPVALSIMGACSFVLVPKVGLWARIAGWSFLCAALQETGLVDGPLAEVRLPVAIAFISIGGVAGRLDPRHRLGWMSWVSALIFLPAVVLTMTPYEAHDMRTFLFFASIVCALVVMLSAAIASSRSAIEDAAQVSEPA